MLPLYRTSLLLLFLFLPVLSNAQDWIHAYDSNLEQALDLVKKDRPDSADVLFTRAYDSAVKNADSTRAAHALITYAKSLYNSSEYEVALNYFKRAEHLYQNVVSPADRGFIKNHIGNIYGFQGNRDSSIILFQQGIDLMHPSDDSSQYATLYRNLSYSYQFLEDFPRSVSMADSALKYSPESDLYAKSRAYLSKYISYLWLGKVEEAEPFILESYSIAQAIQNKYLQLEIYRLMGDYYRRLNDLNKAIIFLRKGLALAESMDKPVDVARYQDLLGRLYLSLGNADQAIPLFNNAHLIYEKLGSESLDAHILHLLGRSFLLRNDYDMAGQLFTSSLAIARENDKQVLAGEILISLADLALLQDEQKKALDFLNTAKDGAHNTEAFWVLRSYQDRLTKLDQEFISDQEKLSITKNYYNIALSLQPESRLNALIKLAQAYRGVGSDSAFIYAEAGLEEIEYRRFSLSGNSLKIGAFSDYATFFNDVGSWYATDDKKLDRAFELFERAKSRALLDQLALEKNKPLQLSESDDLQLLEIQKKIDRLYRSQEESQNLQDKTNIGAEISDLQIRYDALLEEILLKYPEWKEIKKPEMLSLKKVQAMTDKNTAIIEYAFTHSGIAIMLITRDKVHYHALSGKDFSRQTLNRQIDDFRNAIIAMKDEDTLSDLSQPLFDQLIGPLLQYLSGINQLVIVPDGELSLLPFDALLIGDSYLIERFTIKFIPSVGVYNLLPEPHRSASESVLGLAGTGFESDDSGFFQTGSQNAFATLPFTLIEVDSMAKNFDSAKILKNEQVTEAALKKLDLSEFRYIHFATHGAINELVPGQSGLILSKKLQYENLFGEDGYLNANEIAALDLSADMVVLSACNTATGKVISGEGILGLQRAFLTAGASSVVATLWSIYDRSTPVFMAKFYHQINVLQEREFSLMDKLLIKMDWYESDLMDYKSMALREAKLEMLKHPYYSHPVHWASFVIMGK